MTENKVSKKDIFTAGIIRENPVLALMLGLCSTLAITTDINNAIGMGIAVIFVLTTANIIVSLIRKITPDAIRIPVYIVVIATLVKVVELFLHAYVPSLYNALGSFLGLIVVNCIILGRAEAFAAKNTVVDSALDGLGMGIGYTLVIFIISFIRQVLSTGILSLYNPITLESIFNFTIIPESYTIPLFGSPTGAFFTFAMLVAASVYLQDRSNKKKLEAQRAAKQGGTSK